MLLNLPAGRMRLKYSWETSIKTIQPLTIICSSRGIPTTQQTILIYHWTSLLSILLGFHAHYVQNQIHHFLPKPSPLIFSNFSSQSISLFLLFLCSNTLRDSKLISYMSQYVSFQDSTYLRAVFPNTLVTLSNL